MVTVIMLHYHTKFNDVTTSSIGAFNQLDISSGEENMCMGQDRVTVWVTMQEVVVDTRTIELGRDSTLQMETLF